MPNEIVLVGGKVRHYVKRTIYTSKGVRYQPICRATSDYSATFREELPLCQRCATLQIRQETGNVWRKLR